MWKDYSASYIKHNKISSISVSVAALIATLFLSLLCCLFFNFWKYEVDGIVLEEGSWHGRITGQIEETDLIKIQNFSNVESAAINEELSNELETSIDICFRNPKTVYQDMPLLLELLGLEEGAGSYHTVLLSNYLIHDPQDETPPLLLLFFILILITILASLIMIIHNSFAVSMNARIHQFGIFSSIGATPGQIRTCLIQEALVLSVLPIMIGSGMGIAISFGIIQVVNVIADDVAGRHQAVFQYHPLVFIVTILAAFFTVLFSAYIPARQLSRVTPLEAIRNTEGLRLKKKKHSRILSMLFGIEGELAGNALKAQKKALRTATLSLTLSFLAFTVMLCFFTLSGISTNHTYFEQYQDVWDVMVTVKDTGIRDFGLREKLQEIPGVESITVYQKATVVSQIPEDWESDELTALGGLSAVAGYSVTATENTYLVQVPIVILDDGSFTEYCGQIGITPQFDGAVVLNRIWDSIHSNFRYKEFIPYVKENQNEMSLQNEGQDGNTVKIPVLAYTQEVPALREQYANYSLVQFVPLSLWENISEKVENIEADTYIRVLAEEGITLAKLNELEASIVEIVSQDYAVESENRLQEKVTNDEMLNGYMMVIGAFCALLAAIGIANVFSNTLGFLYQRKREFAQYMSIGMTPANIRKMFCVEVFVIAGRPLLITLPLTVVFVGVMITASYLDPMEFISVAPYFPVGLFIVAILGFVAFAYYLGAKRVLTSNLVNALRNDTV